MAQRTFFTIGHSTRTVAELAGLLKAAGADCVADVRTVPRSRTNPQFNADTLSGALAPLAIGYRHFAQLGGWRGRPKGAAASANMFWRNATFRNYADYATGPAFADGLDELWERGREHACAVMCAEALWWRCHRRIIADYLLARGATVLHILGPSEIEPAAMTPAARLRPDGTLIYPGPDG